MVPGWSASVVTGGYVRHLARGYAMLMGPDEDETAVHGCHYRGWYGCAHS